MSKQKKETKVSRIEKMHLNFVIGKTTHDEERQLYKKASEDQNEFDRLLQDTLLRDLLDDPETRKIILSASPERGTTERAKMPNRPTEKSKAARVNRKYSL